MSVLVNKNSKVIASLNAIEIIDNSQEENKNFALIEQLKYSLNIFNKDLPKKYEENPAEYVTVDIGKYDQVLGKSYSEIAALSSSQHKSQGWGRAGERGYSPEFLEFVNSVNSGTFPIILSIASCLLFSL